MHSGEDVSSELDGLPGPGAMLAGKYRLGETLGVGGMGVVVAGVHIHLEQPVAVKMLLPRVAHLPGARDRFVREARAAARIPGEHAVRILDVDTTPEGVAYLIMERLQGADLGTLLAERGQLDPIEAVDFLLQACEGIGAAHRAGIVHRDLKPSNLFLARQPDGRTIVKVLDFGISKTISTPDSPSQTLTDPNAPIGSPQYMAPEQIMDGRSVDSRADLWSIGVLLYELLTGQPPFEAASISHLYVKILHDAPTPIDRLRRGVPPGLARVIESCLAKDRNVRVQSIQDLRALLLPFASPRARAHAASRDDAETPMSIPAISAPIRSVRLASPTDGLGTTIALPPAPPRKRTALVAAIAAVAVAVAALAYAGLRRGERDPSRDLSAPSENVPATPGVVVVPVPTDSASAQSAATPPGGNAQPVSNTPPAAAQTFSGSSAKAKPPVLAASQAPSTAPTARVKDLRDIRPLD